MYLIFFKNKKLLCLKTYLFYFIIPIFLTNQKIERVEGWGWQLVVNLQVMNCVYFFYNWGKDRYGTVCRYMGKFQVTKATFEKAVFSSFLSPINGQKRRKSWKKTEREILIGALAAKLSSIENLLPSPTILRMMTRISYSLCFF